MTNSESRWQQPPDIIRRLLAAPPPPAAAISPDRSTLLLFGRHTYPELSELAAPFVRMGGFRLNPRTRGPQLRPSTYTIEYRRPPAAAGIPVQLPPDSRVGIIGWSPDSRWFAFTLTQPDGIELWLLAADNGLVSRLCTVTLSAVFTTPAQWMPDSRELLILIPAASTPTPPADPPFPPGPVVEECHGKAGPLRTLHDLLRGPHDEAIFEYYGQSQPALIDVDTGKTTVCGPPALYADLDPAPDGQYLLTTTLHRPWSGTLPWSRFPRVTCVRDREGREVTEVFRRGAEENIPIEGVPIGPRAVGWMPIQPTRLVWLEALDGGDPRNTAEHRDRLVVLEAPFNTAPRELLRSSHRCSGVTWSADPELALYREYDRDRRWTRTWQFSPINPAAPPRLLHDRSVNDRYNDPGAPVTKRLPNGRRVLLQHEDCIFLEGPGATPAGDRPFLRRLSLQTGHQETLFLSSESEHESVLLLMEDDASSFMTIHETPASPPNLRIRSLAGDCRPLTCFSDPVPEIRNIHREIISVTRGDGVPLSFTLHLPPGARPGTPLPTLLWAYPREFNDPDTAGQITGSVNRFTTFAGSSPLHLLLAGYAVLDHTTLPVVGDPQTANDTFIEQIVSGAEAIVQRVIDMNVADPARLAVGGHSYGALLAVTLLAHSSLFSAGIARSGAYNRTLTPFGFQNERRTFWEAPEIYLRLSPFTFANRIQAPLLLIHGEADNNPGTFPLQTERLYQAIRGNGGTARCVLLPHESHSYTARQSVEHVSWEMLNWLNRHMG